MLFLGLRLKSASLIPSKPQFIRFNGRGLLLGSM